MKDLNTEKLIEDLCYVNPKYDKGVIEKLEKEFNCEISHSTEKHSELQLTYFYEIDFGEKENFYVEIESGINNGTQVNSAEWGLNTLNKTKIIEVLKEFVLDMDFYERGSFMEKKAQAVLDANKSKLFEFHRKNNYDNYVTGGNSKMVLDPLLSQLHLISIYEEKEVDRNFIV